MNFYSLCKIQYQAALAAGLTLPTASGAVGQAAGGLQGLQGFPSLSSNTSLVSPQPVQPPNAKYVSFTSFIPEEFNSNWYLFKFELLSLLCCN